MNVNVEDRRWLTMSCRFGEAIAERANDYLRRIHAQNIVRGHPDIVCTDPPGRGTASDPGAHKRDDSDDRLEMLDRGRRPEGGEEVKLFAKAADRLQAGPPVVHPDLACFKNWAEAAIRRGEDDAGELPMLVRLIDAHRTGTIIRVVDRCVDESAADVLISTAHKPKGREVGASSPRRKFHRLLGRRG